MTDITISIGQALLILIDKNANMAPASLYLKRLKNLYFSGFKTPEDFTWLGKIKHDPFLHGYQISTSPEIINEDATRRYFETHLAFESMQHKIKSFSLDLAKLHYEHVKDAFKNLGGDLDGDVFKKTGHKIIIRDYAAELIDRKKKGLNPKDLIKGISKREQDTIDRLFSGNYIESDHETAKEYAYLIIQLQNNIELSLQDKEKAIILLKSWRLSMILLRKIKKYQELGLCLVHHIPGPKLYHQGIYLPENRGRKIKEENPQTSSTQAFGLMKNYMPLPQDDKALANAPFDYLKPSEMSTYINEAEWIKYSMGLLVHPYSNAISGVMLLQLRIMLKLNKEEKLCLNNKDKLQDYLAVMIAILTAHTGGHSLLEFTAPTSLPQLKQYFSFMSGYDQITLESMFKENNEEAFERALGKTIAYHNQLLKRLRVQTELKTWQQSKVKPTHLYQYQSTLQEKITIRAAPNEPTPYTSGLASLKR